MGQVGETNHKITGREDMVVGSLLHLVISTRRRKPQRAVWSGPRSDIAGCWDGLGSSEPGSRLVRAHLGMQRCQQPPVYHTRVVCPLQETRQGSFYASFQNIRMVSCSSWKEGQFHTDYILGVDDCPPLELVATKEKSSCGTQRPSWPVATSQSRWVSLSDRDTQ